ncbi:MAG: hypothetical protein ABIH42_07370 [Planctomycetota bacterium]
MPLAFESVNYGRIAFGFFNIESDMLLLEQYFFFASDFCKNLSDIAKKNDKDLRTTWKIYNIAPKENIGDLMGAIHGFRFTGFIGDTYRKYPFPKREEDFKQNQDGDKTQDVFRKMIEKYSVLIDMPVAAISKSQEIIIGDYRFTKDWFHELVNYVCSGGFPGWKNSTRPNYVTEMKNIIEQSEHWLFTGQKFKNKPLLT